MKVALSPTVAGASIGMFVCINLGKFDVTIVSLCTGFGFIVGAFWAERVRKGPGLGMFFR